MNSEELHEALEKCVVGLKGRGFNPRRCPDTIKNPTRTEQLEHLLWMKSETAKFIEEGKIEKAMRWLGFIQGVLWSNHEYDVAALKKMNRVTSELQRGQDIHVTQFDPNSKEDPDD